MFGRHPDSRGPGIPICCRLLGSSLSRRIRPFQLSCLVMGCTRHIGLETEPNVTWLSIALPAARWNGVGTGDPRPSVMHHVEETHFDSPPRWHKTKTPRIRIRIVAPPTSNRQATKEEIAKFVRTGGSRGTGESH
jgi:hypothetical protein